MGFIKGALFGAAIYAAVQHITKKDILTGRSILDDFLERAPEAVERVKDSVIQLKEEFTEPTY